MELEMAAQLRAPFDKAQIGKLPKVTCKDCSDPKVLCKEHKRSRCRVCKAFVSPEHIHIDYVGHAHVRERLLQVDPEWSWRPMAFTPAGLPALDECNGLWIELTVGGTSRLGYGHAGQKRGGDAIKETIGDALRNAAMSFGVALDLWMKDAPAAGGQEPTLAQEAPGAKDVDVLKQLLLAMAKKKGMTIAQLDGEFHTWARGEDEFRKTQDPDRLKSFKTYLEAL